MNHSKKRLQAQGANSPSRRRTSSTVQVQEEALSLVAHAFPATNLSTTIHPWLPGANFYLPPARSSAALRSDWQPRKNLHLLPPDLLRLLPLHPHPHPTLPASCSSRGAWFPESVPRSPCWTCVEDSRREQR